MVHDVDYGKLTKKIVFTENDHRHAKLLVKLNYDGMRQSEFFRHIISGYIEDDERIQEYIDECKQQSLKRKAKSKRLRHQGKDNVRSLALNDGEIENIFDLLEQEFPEL
jgi:hypothetical protein